jgi:hypothetical protein
MNAAKVCAGKGSSLQSFEKGSAQKQKPLESCRMSNQQSRTHYQTSNSTDKLRVAGYSQGVDGMDSKKETTAPTGSHMV